MSIIVNKILLILLKITTSVIIVKERGVFACLY